MSPHHFTRDERLKLETYKSAGYSNAQIALKLGFHKSSIGRELRRNGVRGRYQGDTADTISRARRRETERTRKLEYPPLRRYVIDRSMENWSPAQISGRLRREYSHDPSMQVSHETIYTTAYSDERFGPLVIPYWRQSKKKRQKRRLLKGKREIIKGRVSIEERPQQVADRSRLGDLEGDTVVGSGQSGNILTLVDRKSLYLIAGLCPSKHSERVAQTTINLLHEIGAHRFHTITFDNGTEFAEHAKISNSLSVDVFFCSPLSFQ